MYQHLASHTTLTGISKQIRSTQKSENKSSENLLDHPLNPSVPGSAAQDMPYTCTDIQYNYSKNILHYFKYRYWHF